MRTTKRIALPKSLSLFLHDGYGACIPGLEFAYDNDGSSGHGRRLDLKICEVFALTARAVCGSISLQIEIDSYNTSHKRSMLLVMLVLILFVCCCSVIILLIVDYLDTL